MRYRLVALDIDGTVSDREGKIRPRVKEAVAAAQARGVIVTLATGRRFRAALPIAQDLNIQAPLVLNNGALVADPQRAEVLHYRPLAVNTARLALALLRERGTAPIAYRHTWEGPDVFYERESKDPWFREIENRPGVARKLSNLLTAARPAPDKILVYEQSGVLSELTDHMQQVLPGRFRIYLQQYSDGHGVLELVHAACSKAAALRRMAQALGVPREEILAIGDNQNDLEMLRFAGKGVAMGNATAEIQAHADWVAPSLHEDGVAAALERFVLAPS